MIDRTQFLPHGTFDGDFPVPLNEFCSVPSERMAYLMAELAGSGDCILEIGTGSGYQTAVLAQNWQQVISLEAFPIAGIADKLPSNVVLFENVDGMVYNTGEQFDAILITFAVPSIYPVWVEQLKPGGRLVVPLQSGKTCALSLYVKDSDGSLLPRDVYAYAPFTEAVTIN